MFHEPGQRHVVRRRQLTHRELALAQRFQDPPPSGVGERREYRVELRILILNH